MHNKNAHQPSQAPPVKEGDEIVLTINSVGDKGDGVARLSGYVIFVPKTKAGERVKIRITKTLPKVAFAEVVEHVVDTPAEPSIADDLDLSVENYSEDFGDDEEE